VVHTSSVYDSANTLKVINESYYRTDGIFKLSLRSSDPTLPPPSLLKIWPRDPYANWQIDHAEFCIFAVNPAAGTTLEKEAIATALGMGVLKCPTITTWDTEPQYPKRLRAATITYNCNRKTNGERSATREIRCDGWTNINGIEFPANVSITTQDYSRDTSGKTVAGERNTVVFFVSAAVKHDLQLSGFAPEGLTTANVADYRFYDKTAPWALEYTLSEPFELPAEDTKLIKDAFKRLDSLIKETKARETAPGRIRIIGLITFAALSGISVYFYRRTSSKTANNSNH
jgi:hypothetical protein